MKRLSALQSRPQRSYDSDLESIENPRYPKSDDDEKVKTAPRQSVEPERDIGVNDGGRWRKTSAFGRLKSVQATEVPTAAEKGPAGEATLLGSIGFDGRAIVVCMGRSAADRRLRQGTGVL
jgi:hypothetical protein